MLNRIAAALLCATAPAGLFADSVELRSSDGFISVEGEIVGFNGVMLAVQTSVGRVSVPASEVICYGSGCRVTLANNSFGLTAAAFDDIVATDEATQTPEAIQDRQDAFNVVLAHESFETLYSTVTGAFAVAGVTTSIADLTTPDQVVLRNGSGNEVAVLTRAETGDLIIGTVALRGAAPLLYNQPADWFAAAQPSHQLIGLNAFAVIIAPDVQVETLSMAQIASIYAGEITNWEEVGGQDMKILPLQQPVNSLARNDLITLVMDPAGKQIASDVLTMADETGIAASVNQFPGSISVVSVAAATDNRSVAVSGSCDLASLPSPFNILSADYPLIRPVMASFGKAPETRIVTDMFDFAAERVVQELLSRGGFIDMSAVLSDPVGKNTRISQVLNSSFGEVEKPAATALFETLLEAQRLSPTIIGGTTSGPEGGWNRAMFQLISQALADDAFAGREVIFAGFANSARGPQAAIDLSADAAAQVSAAFSQFAGDLVTANNLSISSRGFGRVAPATCLDGQISKDNYSRVEVWVRDRN